MGDGDAVAGHGLLALGFDFLIAPDGAVAGVQAGHEGAAAGSTDGGSGVTLSKSHPLSGEAIDAGCANQFLPEAANIAVAQVVGEDEDDVGRLLGGEGGGGKKQ